MLKRIQKIQGIGTFASCLSSAKAEFRKTSLIFGYNSRGKSTLTEIFRSIESGNVDFVKSRVTIPGGKSQAVHLNVSTDGGPEAAFIFNGDKWPDSEKWTTKWRVFDSGFINRNVLSGEGVERGHKENLTKFVLGEEGVAKAQAIVVQRQETRRILKESKQVADALKKIAAPKTLDEFVALLVTETAEELKARYEQEIKALAMLKERIAGIDALRRRPKVTSLENYMLLSDTLTMLAKSFEFVLTDVHTEARNRLGQHLERHMNGGHGQRDWIHKGLSFLKSETCPFCEQELNESADELIKQYASAFDEEFEISSKNLRSELANLEDLVVAHKFPNVAITHTSNLAVIGAYPELESSSEYNELISSIEALAREIDDLSEKLRSEVEHQIDSARSSIKAKTESLFEERQVVDFAGFRVSEQRFAALIDTYNDLIGKIGQAHAVYKDTIDIDSLSTEVKCMQKSCDEIAFLIKRSDNDKQCQDYLAKTASAVIGEKKADTMEAELNAEQSAYLDKFFIAIHKYFQIFGSRDFSIEKELDDRGDFPVYILSIAYKKQAIGLDKLGLVFSESDRRALALSIFWARLSLLDEKVLGNTIIVLDDPVTSFDDNRISVAIREFRSMAMRARQVILLSHYRSFVQHYLELEDVDGDFAFIMLEKDDTSSHFVVGDPSTFVQSEHHRRFSNITDYIARRKSDPVQSDLRVYLEEEIKSRYRQQIFNLNIGNVALADMINALHAHGCYPDEICQELHLFRQDLNPTHHKWDTRTPDDWASLAEDVLTLVYQKL